MKTLVKTTIAFCFTLALSAGALFGQVVQFDENGHLFINGAASPGGVLMPDPSGGIAANVLVYQLPFFVNPGDVGLLEAGSTSQTPSDLVRFFNAAGANTSEIIYYSDVESPNTDKDLADTGLPLSPNAIIIPENGPENNNGAVWTPLATQPGGFPTGAQITYDIISDVPEPAFGSLLLLGLATCLGINRLRQNRG
jgi:hypothetical protein